MVKIMGLASFYDEVMKRSRKLVKVDGRILEVAKIVLLFENAFDGHGFGYLIKDDLAIPCFRDAQGNVWVSEDDVKRIGMAS